MFKNDDEQGCLICLPKNKLYSILDFIGEDEATQNLRYVKETLVLKRKTWDDIEEDEPTLDEFEAFNEFRTAKVTNN